MPASEAAVFARLWEQAPGGLTPSLARQLLKLRFAADDQRRMHELVAKNRAGTLTPAERDELDGFVRVADLVAVLQSKARKLVKPTAAGRRRHG